MLHPWLYARPVIRPNNPTEGSKNGHNLSKPPLPFIGKPEDLWPEYLAVDLHGQAKALVAPETWERIGNQLASLPRPLILIHAKGITNPQEKNLPDELVTDLVNQLPGTPLVMDWNCGTSWTLEELFCAYELADFLIGIDSGPGHFARFTTIPALQIWDGNLHPRRFALPRDRTCHLIRSGQSMTWYSHEFRFCESDTPYKAETIIEMALSRLR
jgi:hypothetical protein